MCSKNSDQAQLRAGRQFPRHFACEGGRKKSSVEVSQQKINHRLSLMSYTERLN